jgi:PKD repeat protein
MVKRLFTILFIILSSSKLVTLIAQPLPSQVEYDALVKIYQSLNGDNWFSQNFNSVKWFPVPGQVQDVGNWYGVTSDANGHIIELELPDNDLMGVLPPEIGDLTYLKKLNLSRNNISGQIPHSIGSLAQLEYLHLFFNSLNGDIPIEIWNLSNLKQLYLGSAAGPPEFNTLSGNIPSAISNLNNLEDLVLRGLNLSGSIPIEIGQLQNLRKIYLDANNLSGVIPSSISYLPNLEVLWLGSNLFSGPVPIGTLPNTITTPLPGNFGNYSVDRCHFTFTDLIPVAAQFTGNTFEYAPQNLVDVEKSFDVSSGNLLTLSADVDRNTNPPSLYQWFFRPSSGGGEQVMSQTPVPSINGHTIVINPMLLSGDGWYSYKITNPAVSGLTLKSKDQRVVVNNECESLPEISISTVMEFCGTKFNSIINYSYPSCSSLNYLWDFGDGTTSTEASPSHFYQNDGTYNVSLRVDYSCGGCTNAITKNELINIVNLNASVDFSIQSLYCAIELTPSISYNDNPCTLTEVLWSFGDGTNSTEANPVHVYAGDGIYVIAMRIIFKCAESDCPIEITVNKQINIVNPTATADFSFKPLMCAIELIPSINYDASSCNLSGVLWNFGDGKVSDELKPVHVYNSEGTYTVTLQMYYQCTEYYCPGEVTVTKQITFNPTPATVENLDIAVSTPVNNHVISASAVTFSDVWPLAHDNAALGTKSSYLNGTQGVWRNNASYAYDVPRQQSTPTNIATDGTFTLNQFDWNTASFNVVPDWIQANSMTEYSPYSFELENRDVLGVYSSALYDYGGQLPTANGVNMRHAEMGFTSFEFVDPQGKPSGNWMLSVMQLPATITFQVEKATGYIAEVNSSLEELDLVTKVDVAASAAYFGPPVLFSERLFNYLQEVDILCKQAHPADPNKTIVVLSRAPFDGLWSGRLSIKRTTPPTTKPTLDNAVAHSGKKSLKVTTTPQTFRQEMFQLQAGKTYWVNAWVSVGNPNLLEPKLPNNLGIQLTFLDKIDQSQGSVSFQPVGTIIEGWQQVKGTFICPIDKPTIQLTFRPGDGGIAYYDDLRLQPEKGNMKAYVYNVLDYRLQAILDEENYASFFYYDAEGNLYLTKKETERGIKTITENVSYQIEVIR